MAISLGHVHSKQPRVYIHSEYYGEEIKGRPEHYKQWTNVRMSKVIEAVASGSSVRQAAEEYAVPHSTLHDRITGRVKHGSKSSPQKYLSTVEEEELVSFLKNCSSIG